MAARPSAMLVTLLLLGGFVRRDFAAADPIVGARVGRMGLPQGIDEVKLSVLYWPPPQGGGPPVPEPGLEAMEMTDAQGRRHLCILPNITSEDEDGARAVEDEGQQAGSEGEGSKKGDASLSRKSPEELLNAMADMPCFYRVDGWWTYEFCYQKHIRQLHFEAGEDGKAVVTMEFVLGTFDPAASLEAQKKLDRKAPAGDRTKRFFPQIYKRGTPCDLTGKLRKTEVRFFCEQGMHPNFIASLQEDPTCEYVLMFGTTLLCPHSKFKVEKKPINFINCHAYPEEGAQEATSLLQQALAEEEVAVSFPEWVAGKAEEESKGESLSGSTEGKDGLPIEGVSSEQETRAEQGEDGEEEEENEGDEDADVDVELEDQEIQALEEAINAL